MLEKKEMSDVCMQLLLGRKGRAALTPALFFVLPSEGFQVVVRASGFLRARNKDQVLSGFRLNEFCKSMHVTCCRHKKNTVRNSCYQVSKCLSRQG